jgi:hypothetical protein
MRFIDTIKYTNKYSRINKYLFFVLNLLKISKIIDKDLLEISKGYTKIAGLASGPSLNKCIIDNETLYLTTNSSYLYLKEDTDFVHFIKDVSYLQKFLIFGLKYKPKLVVIEIFTHTNGSGLGELSIKLVEKYLGKRKFKFPIVISNIENLISLNPKSYYMKRIKFMSDNNLLNPDSNSGLMIYGYCIWLTSIISSIKECEIYGLDAGEGGERYFNGRHTMPNHVAMRDENKYKMGVFIEDSQNKFPFIKNYSYFKGTVK